MQTKVKHLTLTFLFFLGLISPLHAQISKEHYIPPISGIHGNIILYKLVLSTLSEEPFTVSITNGDGSYQKEVVISLSSPQEIIPKVGNVFIGFPYTNANGKYPQTNLAKIFNKIMPEHSLTLKGETPFFVNMLVSVPSQAEILTSKGLAGVGTEFYSGHQHMNWVGTIAKVKSHFISVMALENNTEVEFSNPKVRYYDQVDHTFTINLNAGESYIIGNSGIGIGKECGETYKCMNDFNGTKIISNKDIAVNTGSIHGGHSTNANDANRDIGLDQIVPVEYAGKEFILIEGNGTSKNQKNEVGIVVATKANTTIIVNGQTDNDNIYTLAKPGDYIVIPWQKYTNQNMYLKSDQDVFVYQTTAGSNSSVSPGMMFIPRLTEDATKDVIITGVSQIGSPTLYLVVKNGSTTFINGIEIDDKTALKVDGTEKWVAYRITNLIPYGGPEVDFNIVSTGPMSAGVTSISGASGAGGYYSGFSIDKSNTGVGQFGTKNLTVRCEGSIDLLAQGGVSYQWSALDPAHEPLFSPKNDSTYVFSADSSLDNGSYKFQVIITVETLYGDRLDTTVLDVNYNKLNPPFGENLKICVDDTVQVNSANSNDLDEYYTWETHEFLEQTNVASPNFLGDSSIMESRSFLIGRFDDGTCQLAGRVEVYTRNCKLPILKEAFIYDKDHDGIAETVIAKFDQPFKEFEKITSIDWPAEGDNNLSGSQQIASYDTLANGDLDSNTVILTFIDQFKKGTSADSSNYPYMQYSIDSIPIQDRIGPILLSAKKQFPKNSQYAIKTQTGEYTYHNSPIELVITTSEYVDLTKYPTDEIFTFLRSEINSESLIFVEKPEEGEEPNTWIFKIPPNNQTILAGIDSISLNQNANISDSDGNIAQGYNVKMKGRGSIPGNSSKSKFRKEVFGSDSNSEIILEKKLIIVYDENGEFVEEIPHDTKLNSQWIPPFDFIDGKFDSNAPCLDSKTPTEFPFGCYASLAIAVSKEKGPYTSNVFVYDHLGQFLSTWSQRFGYCGEFENENRVPSNGNKNLFMQDLIWNMKSEQNELAGVGVYIWKIFLQFEDGKKDTITKSMGVLRNSKFCNEP